MFGYTDESSSAATRALMFAFAEEYEEQDDEHINPASPFDQDGKCWNDFWATYAEAME